MPSPKEFFADRIDCAHVGGAVILSGEFVSEGEVSVVVKRLRCSHQRQCLLAKCEYLYAGSVQDSMDFEQEPLSKRKGALVCWPQAQSGDIYMPFV